jgi:putative transposon-encoded protein
MLATSSLKTVTSLGNRARPDRIPNQYIGI